MTSKIESEIISQIRLGNPVCLDTDTVTGIACNAHSQHAIDKIFTIKKRDKSKKLALCVPSLESVSNFASNFNYSLFSKYLPGSYTLILPLKPEITLSPDVVSVENGINWVGIRVLPHLSEIIIGGTAKPPAIALTSANISGQEPSSEFASQNNLLHLPYPKMSNTPSTILKINHNWDVSIVR